MEKLYLGQLLDEREIDILKIAEDKNVFVLAPCGCGKSTFLKRNLFIDKNKNYLILVDNTGVKMQTMKEGDICNSKGEILIKNKDGKWELTTNYLGKKNITIMCYAEFGEKIKYDLRDRFINQFDIICCDEVHNLVNYQQIDDSAKLHLAFMKLLEKYDNTKIVWMTATPYYLEKLAKEYPGIDTNFKTLNFTNDKTIKRYTEKRETYISHFSSISTELRQYKKYFEDMNGKVLIYTRNISIMKSIQESLEQLDFLKPICIWSDVNRANKLSDEQIEVRDYLIEKGDLLNPYNCLIINKAYETGLNIFDEKIGIMVAHTTNITEQVQARGRIRHDIDLLVLRTNDKKLIDKCNIEIDEDLIDKWLNKEDLEVFVINKLNLTDDKGRKLTVNKLLNEIEKYNYAIEKRRITEQGKKVTKYIITKSN